MALFRIVGSACMTASEPEPKCPVCGGVGRIRAQQGFFVIERACPKCNLDGNRAPNLTAESTPSQSGYVYVLHFSAGILKIGHTRKHPEDRAAEWGLKLLAYARAEDSADAERRVHEHLAGFRQGKYELFEMSFIRAVDALEKIVGTATIVHYP